MNSTRCRLEDVRNWRCGAAGFLVATALQWVERIMRRVRKMNVEGGVARTAGPKGEQF